MDYVKRCRKAGKCSGGCPDRGALFRGAGFRAFVDSCEELSWAPELLRACIGPNTLEFARRVAAQLSKGLLEEPDSQCHRGIVDCLISLAQSAAGTKI